MRARPTSWSLSLLLTLSLPLMMAHEGGCGSDEEDDGDHDHDHDEEVGPPTGATCPEGSTLTYENFGKPFMESYCLRCHSESVIGADRQGAPSDHNFDDIISIRGLAMHIDQKAGSGPDATNELMPENDPKPTMDERVQLSEWLACGAP